MGVPYVKLYRYNPKHLYPKLNGLSVLWVAYATHSTLKPVGSNSSTIAADGNNDVQIPDAVDTVLCAPDDG
jgi:hypothetical protein